jgi:hypothetical protein
MPPPKLYRVKKVIGFDQAMLDSVEQWRAKQEQRPSVAEAVRQLVALGLGRAKPLAKISSKASSKAEELASHEISRLEDRAATLDERDSRKRRLLKGPSEFRGIRKDHPKRTG